MKPLDKAMRNIQLGIPLSTETNTETEAHKRWLAYRQKRARLLDKKDKRERFHSNLKYYLKLRFITSRFYLFKEYLKRRDPLYLEKKCAKDYEYWAKRGHHMD